MISLCQQSADDSIHAAEDAPVPNGNLADQFDDVPLDSNEVDADTGHSTGATHGRVKRSATATEKPKRGRSGPGVSNTKVSATNPRKPPKVMCASSIFSAFSGR